MSSGSFSGVASGRRRSRIDVKGEGALRVSGLVQRTAGVLHGERGKRVGRDHTEHEEQNADGYQHLRQATPSLPRNLRRGCGQDAVAHT